MSDSPVMPVDYPTALRHLANELARAAQEAAYWRGVAEASLRELARTSEILTDNQRIRLARNRDE